jgi:hypothetical protein
VHVLQRAGFHIEFRPKSFFSIGPECKKYGKLSGNSWKSGCAENDLAVYHGEDLTEGAFFLDEQLERLLEFLESSGPGLHALLTRLTLREDAAEDLMQELFIRLSKSKAFEKARNRGRFRDGCKNY